MKKIREAMSIHHKIKNMERQIEEMEEQELQLMQEMKENEPDAYDEYWGWINKEDGYSSK